VIRVSTIATQGLAVNEIQNIIFFKLEPKTTAVAVGITVCWLVVNDAKIAQIISIRFSLSSAI
jgi:hypothetical protein